MANVQISDVVNGNPPQDADEILVSRIAATIGGNRSLTILQFRTWLATQMVRSKGTTFDDPAGGDDIAVWQTAAAIVIQSGVIVLVGTTPSVAWQLVHSLDRSDVSPTVIASGTATSVTTGNAMTIASANVPSGHFVWYKISTATGATQFHGTVRYA